MANRLNFHCLGASLPISLTLAGTPFFSYAKIWNVIDGEPNGVRTIAFDCQMGSGKHSWRRTVIAIEENGDFGAVLNPEMTIEVSEKWKILYRPKTFSFGIIELMPLEELEAYLSAAGKSRK
jgi:hypothetical protein